MKNIRKILIIKLRDLGDIVLSTPVIRVLYENCNSPEIIYVLKEEYENFKYLLPHIKDVITYNKKDPFDFLRVIGKLRKYQFDLAVNLHATFRSALITLFSGAKIRLVHNHSGKNYFSSMPLNIKEEQKWNTLRDLDTLKPLNISYTSDLIKTKLVFNCELSEYIQDGFYERAIGFGIGAKRVQKKWRIEKFIELGKKLIANGEKIIVFCLPEEKEAGEKIVNELGINARLLIGDILKVSYVIKHLKLFIGNDSGLRHIAAGFGVKTITLFGPENPLEWHPYLEKDGHIAISHLFDLARDGIDIYDRKFREESMEPIERITVDEVFEAYLKLMDYK
ncbi:MAG: glycosyltransferase family 9 protein [Candidatus Goldbacteria bacterium]|nr:glycosyltransferase family 9 protein [Candidatus Goldiibacteriota bacterium]